MNDERDASETAMDHASDIADGVNGADGVGRASETRGEAESAARSAEDAAAQIDSLDEPPGVEDPFETFDAALGGVVSGSRVADGLAGLGPGTEGMRAVQGVARHVGQVAAAARAAGQLVDAVIDLVSGSDLQNVEYRFLIEGEVSREWKVERFMLEERFNAPYACELVLVTEDLTADGNELLGESCGVMLDRAAQVRHVFGIVDRVEHAAGAEGTQCVNIRLVPALEALRHSQDSRIFQDQTVADITEQVLHSELAAYGREVTQELDAAYLTREYCVQYRESKLAFVERLLAEEGIAYHFRHDDGCERVVLTDGNDHFEPALPDDRALTMEHRRDEHPDTEAVWGFALRRALQSTGSVVADFDWTRPDLERREGEAAEDDRGRIREVYEHESPVRWADYDQGNLSHTADDADRQAELRHQASVVEELRAVAGSNCMMLRPGTTFRLSGHPNPDLDQSYLVTSVRHEGARGTDGDVPNYENKLYCIPAHVRFVPSRLPLERERPRLHGFQTATVVGAEGEEVDVDEHGRILVRFHWDRRDPPVDAPSCRVRVVQSWAGAGFGTMFIPRIGMEAVIQFEGGNLDRPICTGCVYNGRNRPPIALPDDKTQSVLRTESSPGGDGYNELRFEDKAGQEEVFVHAQRDLREEVVRNQTTSVGADQSNTVGHDQTVTVRNKRTLHVDGETSQYHMTGRVVSVQGGNDELGVVGHNRDVNVSGGSYTLWTDQQYNLEAAQKATVDVSGTNLTLTPTTIEGSTGVKLQYSVAGSSVFTMEPHKIVLEVGASKIVMLPDKIMVKSNEVLLLSKDSHKVWLGSSILAESPAKVTMRSGDAHVSAVAGDLDATGGNVSVTGDTKTEILGGGASVKLEGGDVDLNS